MRYQKLSRGPNYKRKVMESHIWFGSIFELITNFFTGLEWSNFMLVHFLGTLVDCGAVRNFGDFGFVQFKLRENGDE